MNENDDVDESMVSSQRQSQRSRSLTLVLALCGGCLLLQTTIVQFNGLKRSSPIPKSGSSRFLPESVLKEEDERQTNEEDQNEQGLFVPSLDYRFPGGASQYGRDVHIDAHVYCEEFEKELYWERWKADEGKKLGNLKGHTEEGSGKKPSTEKRLMIGLHSGHDEYATFLQQAVWSARVYGQIWGENVTVVTLQGIAFAPHGCKAPSAHATLNKIRLLFHAIDHADEFDQVLLMDADTMIYNLDVDFTTLLDPDHHLVAAQHSPNDEQPESAESGLWNIDTGVTLWNLHHPKVRSIAIDWFDSAKKAVVRGTYRTDQKYLQASLREHLEWQNDINLRSTVSPILNLQNDEFNFEQGTLVKHFWNHNRPNPRQQENIDSRRRLMRDAAHEMCANHQRDCKSVVQPVYESS
jgi:hypothetical protein